MKKKIWKPIGLGVILGVLMIMLQQRLDVDSDLFLSYYWKIAIAFLLLAVLINLTYYLIMVKKLKDIMAFFEQEDYSTFIERMEAVLIKAKGKHLINVIKINLAAGYSSNKDYAKALDLLNEVDVRSLNHADISLVYWVNRCGVHFKLGDYETFRTDYVLQTALFEKYRDHASYDEALAQLEVLHDIVQGNWKAADQGLAEIRTRWPHSKHQGDYEELQKIIDQDGGTSTYN